MIVSDRRLPSSVSWFLFLSESVMTLLLAIGKMASRKDTACSTTIASTNQFWDSCRGCWTCDLWSIYGRSSLRDFFLMSFGLSETVLGHCMRFFVVLIIHLSHVMGAPLDRTDRLNRSFPLSHWNFDNIGHVLVQKSCLRIQFKFWFLELV